MRRRRGVWSRVCLRVPLALILAALAAACTDDPLTGPESPSEIAPQEFWVGEGSGALKVMTWNVYVGADLDPLLEPRPPEEVPVAVAEAFQQLISTHFPERARAIARQVAYSRPHLIGLQEVSIIRTQLLSDFFEDPTPNASRVLYDYLDILLTALRARGLHYRVAGLIQNADVELPMVVSADPLFFSDVRLTDFDVVLARADVTILDVQTANYPPDKRLIIPFAHPADPDFVIDVLRGYVMVDASIGGRTYRFANTHLEPVQPPGYPEEIFQQLQAGELLAAVTTDPPAGAPIILVGDFNTPAPTSSMPAGPAYLSILGAGFTDVWTENDLPGQGEGLTNPHDADLRNPDVHFTQRIDLIFVYPGPSSVFAWVVGDEQRDRTFPLRLWPSDHAGVVARLEFPTPALLALGND